MGLWLYRSLLHGQNDLPHRVLRYVPSGSVNDGCFVYLPNPDGLWNMCARSVGHSVWLWAPVFLLPFANFGTFVN